MHTIRKIFRIELSHQLFEAYSVDCKNAIHGHSYVCEIYLKSDKLDDTGMVMDFSKVKHLIGDYINSWDHCLVMPDMFPSDYLETLKKYNKKMKVVPYNPTAESMAKDMFDYIKNLIPELSRVRLHETVTGWAQYEQ
jgi:6-pyruvoyltetrahydropterin/6-carboxytetrahydropterin synthase